MKCVDMRFDKGEAAGYVKRNPGSYSFQCSKCDHVHVDDGSGDKKGRLLLMSNEGQERVMLYLQGDIVSVDGVDRT